MDMTEHDYQFNEAGPSTGATPSSTLAYAFSVPPAQNDIYAVASDSDMAPDNDASAAMMAEWPEAAAEGETPPSDMRDDATFADAEQEQQEITMAEFLAPSSGQNDDGDMVDVSADEGDNDTARALSDVPFESGAASPQRVGEDVIASSGDITPALNADDDKDAASQALAAQDTVSEQKAKTAGEEQEPAFVVSSTAETVATDEDPEAVPAQALSAPEAVAQPQGDDLAALPQGKVDVGNGAHNEVVEAPTADVVGTEVQNQQNNLAETPSAAPDIALEQIAATSEMQPGAEGMDQPTADVDRQSGPSLRDAKVEYAEAPEEGATVAAQDEEQEATVGDAGAQEERAAVSSGNSSSTDAARPLRLTFNGQDFVLFADSEPACYYTKAATANGEAVTAPALAAEPEAYHKPLDTFFESLRVQEALGDFLDEGTELRLTFADLDLEVREDDIYAREVTLDDITRLHDGLGMTGSLHIVASEGKRFISRYNELATHVASIMESAAQSNPDDDNDSRGHVDTSAGQELHGVSNSDAVGESNASESPSLVLEAPLAETDGSDGSKSNPPTSHTEGQAENTHSTVASGDRGQSDLDETGRAGPARGDDRVEQPDAHAAVAEEARENQEEVYEDEDEEGEGDVTQYTNANDQYEEEIEETAQGDESHYEPAKETDGDEEGANAEDIVEYDDAHALSSAPHPASEAHADQGLLDDAAHEASEYEEALPPSHKRSHDDVNAGASSDDEYEPTYETYDGFPGEEAKRARLEASEA